MRDLRSQRGVTLLEIMVSVAIFAVLLSTLVGGFILQANLLGQATDAHRTVLPAQNCLQRIRLELKTAVRLSPGYSCTGSSIAFRPLVGYLPATDANFTTKKNAGLISASGIEYEPYVKTIAYDSANKRVTLTVTGTVPSGMKTSETLADDVELFAVLNGNSIGTTPPAADNNTDTVLVRVQVERVSAAPGARGAVVTSNVFPATLVGSGTFGTVLSTKVRMFPELLVNSQVGAITSP